MDHIWNSLKQWELLWEERLEAEKNGPVHEYKKHNIEVLTKQLDSIRKALKEIGQWV